MTNTKGRAVFTPGPWVCHSGMVWKDGPNVYPKGTEDGIPIATMCREPNNGTLPVERDANARLIAASPQLLKAVHGLLWLHNNRHNHADPKFLEFLDAAAVDAEAAIRAVEGE